MGVEHISRNGGVGAAVFLLPGPRYHFDPVPEFLGGHAGVGESLCIGASDEFADFTCKGVCGFNVITFHKFVALA